MRHYRIQLHDHRTGEVIQTAGGVCYVAKDGDAAKETLYQKDGSSQTNPVSLSNGLVEFYVADTVNLVDFYIMAPGGHFITLADVAPSGPNEIMVDQGQKSQLAIIPFAIGDTTATTETDTGFNEPSNALIKTAAVRVSTADATETIDVGTDSTDSGDANGFMSGVALDSATIVTAGPTVTAGTNETYFASTTLGALLVDFLAGSDTATDVGTNNTKDHVSTGKSITYTLTAGTDTAEGFILLPYDLTS